MNEIFTYFSEIDECCVLCSLLFQFNYVGFLVVLKLQDGCKAHYLKSYAHFVSTYCSPCSFVYWRSAIFPVS